VNESPDLPSIAERLAQLRASLRSSPVSLCAFDDTHVDALRQACAADPHIWTIYPVCLAGEHFAPTLAMLRGFDHWALMAVQWEGRTLGMTSFILPTTGRHLEIGATFLDPSLRGTGCNRIVKQLMIDRAFALDHDAVEFKVDTRNGRSRRAVEKLGASLVTVRQRDMTTWTGYCRDTAVYRLDKADWPTAQP